MGRDVADGDDVVIRAPSVLVFTLFVFSIAESQNAADVTMSCPAELLEYNRTYDIRCVVNSAAIASAGCQPSPAYLKMAFASTDDEYGYVCFGDYPCDLTGSDELCVRCVSSVDNVYTYSLRFDTSEDLHGGGSVDCLLDCPESTRNITYDINSTCLALRFPPRHVDGVLICPTAWIDQETSIVTCEVNTTSVNSTTCPGGSGQLSLDFTPSGGARRQACVVPSYLDAACDGVFNGDGCRCKEHTSNNTYVFEYAVTANVSYNGGAWACSPTCFFSNNTQVPMTIDSYGNCTNVGVLVPQYAGTLLCPAAWSDQETTTLVCEINATSVNSAACPGGSGNVSFVYTSSGGAVTRSCVLASYLGAACDGIFNAQGCRCKERTANDTYVLEHALTADVSRHAGGAWACVPGCLDDYDQPVDKATRAGPGCRNVRFATVSKITTTTREKATSVTTTTKTRIANATAILVTETTTTKTTATVTVHTTPREIVPAA